MNDILATAEICNRWVQHPTVQWVTDRNPDITPLELLTQLSDVLNTVEEAFPNVSFGTLFPSGSEPMAGKGVRKALLDAGMTDLEAKWATYRPPGKRTLFPDRFTGYARVREAHESGDSFTTLQERMCRSDAAAARGLAEPLEDAELEVAERVLGGEMSVHEGAAELKLSPNTMRSRVYRLMYRIERGVKRGATGLAASPVGIMGYAAAAACGFGVLRAAQMGVI